MLIYFIRSNWNGHCKYQTDTHLEEVQCIGTSVIKATNNEKHLKWLCSLILNILFLRAA